LEEEIAEHGVQFPPSKEADDIRVDICTEECHGTFHLEGVGRDVARVESHSVVHDGGCHTEGGGDVFGQDAMLVLGMVIVCCKGEP